MIVDFDTLPDAVAGAPDLNDEPDDTPDVVGPSCQKCSRPIMRKPGARGRVPKWHPECRPSATGKAGAPKRSRKATGPSYEEGLNGLFQMASFGLMVAAGDHSEPLLADSKAVAEYGPGISAAVNQLAQEKPEIANVLEKILAMGPYSLVIGAVVPLVFQVAKNHGVNLPNVPTAHEYLHAGVPGSQQ